MPDVRDVRVDLDIVEPAIQSALAWLEQERRLLLEKLNDLESRSRKLRDLLDVLRKERG